jgi:hypothetical protein
MNIKLINFLYWLNSTLQLVLMKIITYNYHIDNIVFNSVFRCIMLPYYIYKLIKHHNKHKNEILVARWYDVVNGTLDQLDITLSYIGFSGLTIGEYITFRTFSVFLGGLYLIIYQKKMLSLQKMISISLILTACITLLGFYNEGNLFYSLTCITSSIAYSLIGFIIEVNIKTDEERELNFYWTKTISYIIALFFGLVSEFLYHTISIILSNFFAKQIIIIVALEIIIALLENFYYYLKINSISKSSKNGSIIIQFLDIMRRFTLIVIGAIYFYENYTPIIYFSVSLMFVGSLIGLFDYENFIYLYHKYVKKHNSNYIINQPSIEIVCANQ